MKTLSTRLTLNIATRLLTFSMLTLPSLTGFSQGTTAFTYQGRLDFNGVPANGTFDFRLEVFDALEGGSSVSLVIETNAVPVTKGLFTIQPNFFFEDLFDGQARWLELAVRPAGSADAYHVLQPRQQFTPTPYALHASRAYVAETANSLEWNQLTRVPAQFADGIDDDTTYSAGNGLSLSGTQFSVAPGGIQGTHLADGAVAATKLADGASLAEILDDDGPGSGLNADLLDGMDATAFASSAHNHYAQIWSGSARLGLDLQTSAVGSEVAALRGRQGMGANVASAVPVGVWGESKSGNGIFGASRSGAGVYGESVDGYGVYASSHSSHALYADGSISASRLVYNTPRIHHFSIPGDTFRPRRVNSTIAFEASIGTGGAYFTAGTEILMLAPVHLPDGAVITSLRAYFQDDSPLNLNVSLTRHLTTYYTIAALDSSGISGYGDKSVAVSNPFATVRNDGNFYLIHVYSTGGSWSTAGSALRIQGVTIGYTVSEAE